MPILSILSFQLGSKLEWKNNYNEKKKRKFRIWNSIQLCRICPIIPEQNCAVENFARFFFWFVPPVSGRCKPKTNSNLVCAMPKVIYSQYRQKPFRVFLEPPIRPAMIAGIVKKWKRDRKSPQNFLGKKKLAQKETFQICVCWLVGVLGLGEKRAFHRNKARNLQTTWYEIRGWCFCSVKLPI